MRKIAEGLKLTIALLIGIAFSGLILILLIWLAGQGYLLFEQLLEAFVHAPESTVILPLILVALIIVSLVIHKKRN